MPEYRITKYDPQYRVNGVYERYEWSSVSDVGQEFADGVLTQAECDRTIDRYVACALEIMKAARVQALTIMDLEDFDLRFSWYSGLQLPPNRVAEVIRACLEEKCWCRLVSGEGFIHFGYDLYMYVGCELPFGSVQDIGARYGLFAEAFPSPYSEGGAEKEPSPFTFATESQAPAAAMISDCLCAIERKIEIPSLAPYTDALIHADKAERMRLCRENIERSLAVVKESCDKKKLRFDLDALLADLFPHS